MAKFATLMKKVPGWATHGAQNVTWGFKNSINRKKLLQMVREQVKKPPYQLRLAEMMFMFPDYSEGTLRTIASYLRVKAGIIHEIRGRSRFYITDERRAAINAACQGTRQNERTLDIRRLYTSFQVPDKLRDAQRLLALSM